MGSKKSKHKKKYKFKNEKLYREKYKELFKKPDDEINKKDKSKRVDNVGKEKKSFQNKSKDIRIKKDNKKEINEDLNLENKKKADDNQHKKDKVYSQYGEEVEKLISKRQKIRFFKILLVIVLIMFIFILVYFGYRSYVKKQILKEINSKINVEYGNEISEKDILKGNFKKVSFTPKLSSLKKIGEHEVILNVNGYEFKVFVNIRDTISPDLEVHEISKYLDEQLPKVDDFVSKVEDLSDVSLKMSEIVQKPGEQEVEITATDKYGNKTSKTTKLKIVEYKGSVKINGLTNLTVYVNSKPDLNKGVSATDWRFGSLNFSVDDSKVNYSKPGSYKIYYTVKDKLGNVTTKERKITVKERTVMINNFPTYSQFPNYPNGCETIALYLMLKYYGVSVSPETLVNNLRNGDGVHWENNIRYGGDPEIEFVGDPRDQHGYGCYQRPIINLANRYKSGMVDYTGHSLNQVLELVRSGKPVQVWVSINLKNTSVCADWIHKASGKKINWICSLHSVVVIGFNDSYVYVSDPYTGDIERYRRGQFQKIYNLFGKRALYFR